MKALSIGSSLLEITCQVNEPLKENSVMRLSDKTECGGGHAGNIAYLLGKWGIETYIASMMGSDDNANKIKKEYEAIGVKIDCIETSFDKPTSQAIVLVNTTNKNKNVFEITSNAFLKKYAFGMEPDIIVSDGNDFTASVAAFDKYPKAMSFLTVTRVTQEIIELCKYVQYIIFNRSSAEMISGQTIDYSNGATLVNVYNRLKQRFNKSEIIITLGERGSIYALNGEVRIMPTIVSEIVDTNGAGDAYVGAFIYGMGRNFGIEKSVVYATIAGALSTTKLTSRNSIPSLNDVASYYDKKFGTQNVEPNVELNMEQNIQANAQVAPQPQNNQMPTQGVTQQAYQQPVQQLEQPVVNNQNMESSQVNQMPNPGINPIPNQSQNQNAIYQNGQVVNNNGN